MYTKGPWQWVFVGTAGQWRIEGPNGLLELGGWPDAELSDDMRLIAAAPDLLEALETARHIVEMHAGHDVHSLSVLANIDAAIKRARGE